MILSAIKIYNANVIDKNNRQYTTGGRVLSMVSIDNSIQKALEELMKGKTVIAIAHRLSTISKMDRIIVMENGQVEEDGTHKQLLEKNGLYANFWKRQSGGFIGSD